MSLALMIDPDGPLADTSGAGRFANGVEPAATGGWKGRATGVLGGGAEHAEGQEKPKGSTYLTIKLKRLEAKLQLP